MGSKLRTNYLKKSEENTKETQKLENIQPKSMTTNHLIAKENDSTVWLNSDLKIKYPSKDLISILASNLTKLDLSISNPGLDPNNISDSQDTKELKDQYKQFLSRFSKIGQVSNMVLVTSLILAKRVYKNAYGSYNFSSGDF